MHTFRNSVSEADFDRLRYLLMSTGFFDQAPDEIDVAIELAQDAVKTNNDPMQYAYLLLEDEGQVRGFVCYGKIACTLTSFEVYWICVGADYQGRHYGKALLAETQKLIADLGGRKIMIQTAGRDQYIPTHRFYESCGYKAEARLKDYYAPGDDAVIYTRDLD